VNHPILGEIRPCPDVSDAFEAAVRHESRTVRILISADDRPIEATIALAAEVATKLRELDETAKRLATTEMLGTYNAGWNDCDIAQDDGSIKSVSNPQLSDSEFCEKLSLDAIDVTGDTCVSFFYKDGGLFWGHSIVVNSMQGTDFSEAYSELFG
jgi:hypothetical protein